ncbi:hypothetical protein BLAHAN_04581 [Blautia hansenii DSM 20583]|uniref:Uncharacterized protein n=1 Tax=Blautia hansenii DSM 20583 TaxID=537007 RepID=C9L5D0_BLAHA|nr:hypothetical protein BLAHAN_04581 [Blautia hansenii DSM 20583]
MESIPIPANWLRNKNYILDKCRYMISEIKSYVCFFLQMTNLHEELL